MNVEWSDLEAAAKAAFNVWRGAPELAWAKQAWGLLEQARLAEFQDEFQRHEVLFRFLSLGGLYRDFCAVAWEETTDRWYSEWAECLDIDPFILGQWYASAPDAVLIEEPSEALAEVVERHRPEVVKALLTQTGGCKELYAFFMSSRRGAAVPRGSAEDDVDGIWECTMNNAAAFAWVEQGCLPYLLE